MGVLLFVFATGIVAGAVLAPFIVEWVTDWQKANRANEKLNKLRRGENSKVLLVRRGCCNTMVPATLKPRDHVLTPKGFSGISTMTSEFLSRYHKEEVQTYANFLKGEEMLTTFDVPFWSILKQEDSTFWHFRYAIVTLVKFTCVDIVDQASEVPWRKESNIPVGVPVSFVTEITEMWLDSSSGSFEPIDSNEFKQITSQTERSDANALALHDAAVDDERQKQEYIQTLNELLGTENVSNARGKGRQSRMQQDYERLVRGIQAFDSSFAPPQLQFPKPEKVSLGDVDAFETSTIVSVSEKLAEALEGSNSNNPFTKLIIRDWLSKQTGRDDAKSSSSGSGTTRESDEDGPEEDGPHCFHLSCGTHFENEDHRPKSWMKVLLSEDLPLAEKWKLKKAYHPKDQSVTFFYYLDAADCYESDMVAELKENNLSFSKMANNQRYIYKM